MLCGSSGGRKLTPFHMTRNAHHHSMSKYDELVRQTWRWSFPAVVERSIKWHRNVQPGLSTADAWWSCPIIENSSLLVHDFFTWHPFGLRSAPKVFSAVADALLWAMHQNGITHVLRYLDDFLFVDEAATPLDNSQLQVALHTCWVLEVLVTLDKVHSPTEKLTFLGTETDSVSLQLCLPDAKLMVLRSTLQQCCVNEESSMPVHPQQMTINWVDWHHAVHAFDVQLWQKQCLAWCSAYVDSLINWRVLKRTPGRVNPIIHTIAKGGERCSMSRQASGTPHFGMTPKGWSGLCMPLLRLVSPLLLACTLCRGNWTRCVER